MAEVVHSSPRTLVSPVRASDARPDVRGKFIFVGEKKFYVRGVTYGPFRGEGGAGEYHGPEYVRRDFMLIAEHGFNAIRTYTVPTPWILDLAGECGLRVMVGIPWEQHVAFLDNKKLCRDIETRVRAGVRACAGHPSILCYAVGNEIPASIVRWHGRHRVERFIRRLYEAAKSEDPGSLVTYVNYPSTEYLQLPFLDLFCFNVYLESQQPLEAYLARLQNIAGDRPVVLAEVGLDSRRNGEETQARVLEWQIQTAFTAGCAGLFLFAWTDEWFRGGHEIEDWDFGLTTRDRSPKPALGAVQRSFADVPFLRNGETPRISVVVCAYNGAETIAETLSALSKVEYPNFEVIVVDDGSTDRTAEVAGEFSVKVIRTENRGLSAARNTGMQAATGEIVAYIDADAYPDPHWLTYLAYTFASTNHAAVGGPNIIPRGDGWIAECVANAPGAPVHVLLSDREAEHIPGCNMAFRKSALEAVGGLDPQFRIAGDDVDLCWRLQQNGWTIGFSPAAVVWHHRRNSVGAYWKQQLNYGKAEALLEKKWPEKYNALGHLTWRGRLYGDGHTTSLFAGRWQIYHGVWGSGLFQSIYPPRPGMLPLLPLIPEGYIIVFILAVLLAISPLWSPLKLALPLFVLSLLTPIFGALLNAGSARYVSQPRSWTLRLKMRALTALLHLLQPLARLLGRLRNGLTPWRRRAKGGFSVIWSRGFFCWDEHWKASGDRIESLERGLKESAGIVRRGGDFDRWDLEVRNGMLGSIRIRMATEEHGAGKQLFRVRTWPDCSPWGLAFIVLFSLLCAGAALDKAYTAAGILGTVALLLILFLIRDCGTTAAAVAKVLRKLGYKET